MGLLLSLCLSHFSTYLIAEQLLIHEKNSELEDLNSKIEQLVKQVAKAKDKHDKLIQALRKIELTLGELSQQLEKHEQSISTTQNNINALNLKISKQEQNLQQQYSLLAQQIRAAYQLGQASYLKVILNQTSLNDMNRLYSYYNYLNNAQKEFINAIHNSLADLNMSNQTLEHHKQVLNQLIMENHENQQALKQNQAYRLKIINAINSGINKKNNQLQGLLADKKELEKLITHLNRKLIPEKSATPFIKMQKHLKWPATGDIINSRSKTQPLKFEGVFLAAPAGEPVYAIHEGQVVFANWLRGFGLLVIIDHGAGYMSLYAHNQSLYVTEGDSVTARELIGRVGNSGGNNQDGLYFEIRHNGKPVNPHEWVLSSHNRAL